MAEKSRVVDTADEDPRKQTDDDLLVYDEDGVEVHQRPNDRVHIRVPKFAACVTDARDLRDALDEYLDDDEHESAAFPDASVTVAVDADVEAARGAIESLQTNVEALNEELKEAAERAADVDLGAVDFGLPAPSPSDVQVEMEAIETDDREMVPAEPLYELAEMWAGVSVHPALGDEDARTYRQARKESGEWLKTELDELTEDDDG